MRRTREKSERRARGRGEARTGAGLSSQVKEERTFANLRGAAGEKVASSMRRTRGWVVSLSLVFLSRARNECAPLMVASEGRSILAIKNRSTSKRLAGIDKRWENRGTSTQGESQDRQYAREATLARKRSAEFGELCGVGFSPATQYSGGDRRFGVSGRAVIPGGRYL